LSFAFKVARQTILEQAATESSARWWDDVRASYFTPTQVQFFLLRLPKKFDPAAAL
jgi:hypothetical protein